MLKNYTSFNNEIKDKVPLKKIVLNKISAFILSFLIVLPFILLDIDLIQLYYELQVLLVLILCVCFVSLVFLYTFFYISTFKTFDLENYNKRFCVYKFNLILSSIFSLFIFLLFLLAR